MVQIFGDHQLRKGESTIIIYKGFYTCHVVSRISSINSIYWFDEFIPLWKEWEFRPIISTYTDIGCIYPPTPLRMPGGIFKGLGSPVNAMSWWSLESWGPQPWHTYHHAVHQKKHVVQTTLLPLQELHPWRLMEHNHGGLEDHLPFKMGDL